MYIHVHVQYIHVHVQYIHVQYIHVCAAIQNVPTNGCSMVHTCSYILYNIHVHLYMVTTYLKKGTTLAANTSAVLNPCEYNIT